MEEVDSRGGGGGGSGGEMEENKELVGGRGQRRGPRIEEELRSEWGRRGVAVTGGEVAVEGAGLRCCGEGMESWSSEARQRASFLSVAVTTYSSMCELPRLGLTFKLVHA